MIMERGQSKKDMLQIDKCRGCRVKVEMKNGDVVFGRLAFFNYKEQVIHLEDYTILKQNNTKISGGFFVINRQGWYTLQVKDLSRENGGYENDETNTEEDK